MPKRLRLTRRFPVALTNDAYRALCRLAEDAGLSTDEALVFLFENFGSVVHKENLAVRLKLFQAELSDRKA
ncbi:hypothetical protein [Phaeovulum sp.]|jgi:hypothetical protein|uniref:hypothetical protein n=1 Tax=Phaeovulum sp. TaxID=2934796 RepID=UPI00272F199F|nr:hypothetical protein [Phaeovulum sp.]MDP1669943.1 hypothetical protein [Phaeovulum sp.]MDP2062011.1 hypothetical protein [Phaeovulum sp.]MDP3860390.1 hypothetical protein [Phaeovulum sp.]MDZ4118655.1 hypothetical protein [Phaeovulum sp.]